MRHFMSITLLAAAVCLAAQPALAEGGVCLNVKNIKNSEVAKDGTSVTFEMKDGKIWRNDLAGTCPDAWFNGFAWTVKADVMCDDEPGFTVINSGQVCKLGKFTAMTPAPR